MEIGNAALWRGRATPSVADLVPSRGRTTAQRTATAASPGSSATGWFKSAVV